MPVPEHVNPRDSLHREIAELRNKLADREAELAELRVRMTPHDLTTLLPSEWHLTKTEARVLVSLFLANGIVLSKEAILQAVYSDRPDVDEPELKIVDVFICKIRRKMEHTLGDGSYIETLWGRGYRLVDDFRETVKAAMERIASKRHDEGDLAKLQREAQWRAQKAQRAALAMLTAVATAVGPVPDDADAKTPAGRRAFGRYLTTLQIALNVQSIELARLLDCDEHQVWSVRRGTAAAEWYGKVLAALRARVGGPDPVQAAKEAVG